MSALNSFLEWSLSVQQTLNRSLSPGDAVVPWRDLVERERRALEQLPRNADDIPTHIIPAAYPENPDDFVEEEERREESSSSLREVQDQAYEESLLQDRVAEEERAMRAALEESRREAEERGRAQLLLDVPPEPAPSENCCALVLRLPDGARVQRRMLRSDSVGTLRRVVASMVGSRFAIVMDYPRRRFDDDAQTLESAGMWPRAAINIVEVEEEGNSNL